MEEKNLNYYIRLLEANKNLILTGAPGTGKTYLAKAIADAMGAEYEFVQFHPSYDYTDFVEGLRPTPPDKNGNIGFERKDGVFKEFCKRAISETYSSDLKDDDIILFMKCFYDLIDDIKDKRVEYIQLKQKQSKRLSVTSKNSIKWQGSTNENTSTHSVKLNSLIQLYNAFRTTQEVEGMNNISQTIRNIIGGCNATYYWGVLHEVLRRKENHLTENNITSTPKSIDIQKYINPDIEIKSSIRGYRIPFTDVIKAYENRLWEGGQRNGNDSYTAALAKYIYEKKVMKRKAQTIYSIFKKNATIITIRNTSSSSTKSTGVKSPRFSGNCSSASTQAIVERKGWSRPSIRI